MVMPIGPLMIEHRLIERVIAPLQVELGEIARRDGLDAMFIDTAVDFFRTYSDRTHHGKEEDILFRDLEGRDLAPEDRRIMDELIAEHVQSRHAVRDLVEAKNRFLDGHSEALGIVVERLNTLVALYPRHIAKEDKTFFPAAMHYLNREEQAAMLVARAEFDQRMIHEKYRAVVEQLEMGSAQKAVGSR